MSQQTATPTYPRDFRLCLQCGEIGRPRTATRGGGVMGCLLTIVLLCLAVIPGILYLLWQHSTKHQVCAKCGASTLAGGAPFPLGHNTSATFSPRSRWVAQPFGV